MIGEVGPGDMAFKGAQRRRRKDEVKGCEWENGWKSRLMMGEQGILAVGQDMAKEVLGSVSMIP